MRISIAIIGGVAAVATLAACAPKPEPIYSAPVYNKYGAVVAPAAAVDGNSTVPADGVAPDEPTPTPTPAPTPAPNQNQNQNQNQNTNTNTNQNQNQNTNG